MPRYSPITSSNAESNTASIARYHDAVTNKTVIIKKFFEKEQYIKELKLNMSVSDLNVIHVIDYNDDEQMLVMEDGGDDLFNLLQNEIDNEYDTLRKFRNIFESLAALHRKQMIHGDVKLENIVSKSDDDSYFLIDFGLSESLRGKDLSYKQFGTQFYLPPEAILKKGHDYKADVYALGVTLYAALTGQFPYNTFSSYEYMTEQVSGDYDASALVEAGCHEKTIDVVCKMLEPNPMNRPTMQECIDALYSDDLY